MHSDGMKMIGVLAFLISMSSLAQVDEKQVRELARQRLYPGGKDEEPLKVLSAIPSSVRKKSANMDFEAEPASEPVDATEPAAAEETP